MNTPWNSLEIAKLIASSTTPLLILCLGLFVQRAVRRIEAVQWANRKIVEKRLAIYDDIAPLLNDLLCYFSYVGNWKELTPPQLVAAKRILDKRVHLAAPLFSAGFLSLYNEYIHLCFSTYNGLGEDAKLRTRFDDRAPYSREPWDSQWVRLFAPAREADPGDIIQKYDELMACFSRELGLGLAVPPSLLPRHVAQREELVEAEWRKWASKIARALPWRDARAPEA